MGGCPAHRFAGCTQARWASLPTMPSQSLPTVPCPPHAHRAASSRAESQSQICGSRPNLGVPVCGRQRGIHHPSATKKQAPLSATLSY
eukprot:347715-Chlamydomonas_euryale.AAC.5